MNAAITIGRVTPEGPLDVPDDDTRGNLPQRLGDLTTQLVAAGVIALIATCIRVWAGMDVIQTQISNLTKSDNRQDQLIEQVRTELNTVRVQVGVLRALSTGQR
jgi:hypothetical protein